MAMTMTISNNSSAKRITVQIPTSSGDAIEAWVYLPEGSGPHPAVVMAHGIGGIKPLAGCPPSLPCSRPSLVQQMRRHPSMR